MAVIVAYFGAMLVIGWRAMRNIRNQEDFFLGGRRFGKWIQVFAAFGQGTSAESAVGMTTLVRTNGASGIWSTLAGGLFFMPIFWLTSVWYRRMRTLTLADFFTERYGSRSMAGFYSLFQAVFFMIVAALGLSAMSKTIAAMTVKPVAELSAEQLAEYNQAIELERLEHMDFSLMSTQQEQRLDELRLLGVRKEFPRINERMFIVCVAAFVLVYAALGGLEAAFVTDLIQSVFIILMSLLLIPFAMMRVNEVYGTTGFLGPFEVMHQRFPQSFFEVWGSPNVLDFTWHWIAVMAILGMLNVGIQANQMVLCGSAKDELTARVGLTLGMFLKRYFTVVWGFVAMITALLYGSTVKNPDYIWGYATRDLLGPLGIGLVGLMIACMVAALMSTADALMITSSGLLTNNVYRPLFPRFSEKHYLLVGRVFGGFYILGAVLIATQYQRVFSLMKLIWVFNCVVAASFWLGMLWRRATVYGAWSSISVTAVFTVLLPLLAPAFPGVRTNPYLAKTTLPASASRVYTAVEADVEQRALELTEFDQRVHEGPPPTRPQPLTLGETFTKTFTLPKKSIFWEEDLALIDGRLRGRGMLKVELVLLDWLGVDLARNSHSLNETISLLFRLIVPFGTLICISMLTRRDDEHRLNRFYAKMKTPVAIDPASDRQQVELSMQSPRRFDSSKLFPNSNWEFQKWSKDDAVGVSLSCVGVLGCVLLLYLAVTLGSRA
ncbi:MAG TPA: sodium:solute symporter family protein [Lacipirellulaceae bacterium]|nr:sodium:solute symporter family protein [Lacipirellulaceae bacterium]